MTKATKMIRIKQAIKGTSVGLQKGADGWKVPLGCVPSKSIHSCPRVRDKHLAAS